MLSSSTLTYNMTKSTVVLYKHNKIGRESSTHGVDHLSRIVDIIMALVM